MNRPFDEQKYKRLLEGLEISEVNYQSLEDDRRVDAEYYRPKFLRDDVQLKTFPQLEIEKIAFVSDGQHGYYETDENSTIRMLAAKNAIHWFADRIDAERLAKWVDDQNKRSSLCENDIILSTRGTVGYCALVGNDVLPANLNQDVARIMLQTNEISPEFLLAYFRSSYGQDWLLRNQSGMVQQGIPLKKLRTMFVPVLKMNFQLQVKQTIQLARKIFNNSIKAIKSANDLLLHELGLEDWQPPAQSTVRKNFSDFLATGRLDAEYYQPKYDALDIQLSKTRSLRLGDIARIEKSIEPGSNEYQDEGLPFIRVADLSAEGLTPTDIFLDPKKYANALRPKKNTILLSKDGSVGIAYKVEEDMEAVTSSAILHLNVASKNVDHDYLTLVLNSIVVRMQAERDVGGSIIQHWKPSEISAVAIPILPASIQSRIAQKIRESFALRAQSQQLLTLVQHAVETAIEHGEAKGFDILEGKTDYFHCATG